MYQSYHCPHCHYITNRSFNFKRHIKAVHKLKVADNQSQSNQDRHVTFQCPNCQYKTKRFYDFRKHNKVVHNMIVDHRQDDLQRSSEI